MDWKIYYRGSLSSCNFDCGYCPFAKTRNSRTELAQDRQQLERFLRWVEAQSQSLGILFTPWGEALVHRSYRQALLRLSRLPQVARVAIQTNLSAPLGDLRGAGPALALWCSFHPGQVSRSRFLRQCRQLDQMEIAYSVGVVGVREHFAELTELRQQLPPRVYLWINAYKRQPDYYTPQEVRFLQKIDPLFGLNLATYPSQGRPCQAGQTHFTVDGHGDVRRCHFVGEVLGNLYRDQPGSWLKPRHCPNDSCRCYIGYIHLPHLDLEAVYGDGLLARIPVPTFNAF